MERASIRKHDYGGASGVRVRLSNVGLAQARDGAMVAPQVWEGADAEVHDTAGATMLQCETQGVMSGAHVTQGDVIAKECWIDG